MEGAAIPADSVDDSEVASQSALDGVDKRTIDPNGDVIFAVSDHTCSTSATFMASSKVLGLASAVFHAMFKPLFKEGLSILNGNCPTIDLEHDDPIAFGIIFQILHHQCDDIPEVMSAELLFRIANLCDKYACLKPLRPWMLLWLGEQEPMDKSPMELGFLLQAACIFDAPVHFADISVRLIKDFKLGFSALTSWPELPLIPGRFIGDIENAIKKTLQNLIFELQNAESKLRDYPHGHRMDGRICSKCGVRHSSETRRCHPCKNTEFFPEFCSRESRIANYFAALKQAMLWPLPRDHEIAVKDILFRVSRARANLKHDCEAGLQCPLKKTMEELKKIVSRNFKNIKGLCLYCLKEADGEDSEIEQQNGECGHYILAS